MNIPKSVLDDIERISKLEYNWDGEGSLPCKEEVLANLMTFFGPITFTENIRITLHAVADGSIDVMFTKNSNELLVNVSEDRIASFYGDIDVKVNGVIKGVLNINRNNGWIMAYMES